jgi:hypothetical protein
MNKCAVFFIVLNKGTTMIFLFIFISPAYIIKFFIYLCCRVTLLLLLLLLLLFKLQMGFYPVVVVLQ